MPCPALPCPALPCPALPCPALSLQLWPFTVTYVALVSYLHDCHPKSPSAKATLAVLAESQYGQHCNEPLHSPSCRDVSLDLLQSNLGHCQLQPSHLVRVAEGCQQQPCLVRIAGRALAQGCVAPQDIISHAPGKPKQTLSSLQVTTRRHLHIQC